MPIPVSNFIIEETIEARWRMDRPNFCFVRRARRASLFPRSGRISKMRLTAHRVTREIPCLRANMDAIVPFFRDSGQSRTILFTI